MTLGLTEWLKTKPSIQASQQKITHRFEMIHVLDIITVVTSIFIFNLKCYDRTTSGVLIEKNKDIHVTKFISITKDLCSRVSTLDKTNYSGLSYM